MKNILLAFLLFFSLDLIAQDNTNPIDFKFEADSSTSIPLLYLKCQNNVYFSVSDTANLEKLSYTARGGNLILKDPSKLIVIVPNSRTAILTVLYDGEPIAELTCRVEVIPAPTISIREIKGKKVLTEFPKILTVDILADETFEKNFPNEARYRATKYFVAFAKGKRLINLHSFDKGETFTEEDIKKYTELIKAEPKEDWRLVVEVKEILRLNSLNKADNVNLEPLMTGENNKASVNLPIRLE